MNYRNTALAIWILGMTPPAYSESNPEQNAQQFITEEWLPALRAWTSHQIQFTKKLVLSLPDTFDGNTLKVPKMPILLKNRQAYHIRKMNRLCQKANQILKHNPIHRPLCQQIQKKRL